MQDTLFALYDENWRSIYGKRVYFRLADSLDDFQIDKATYIFQQKALNITMLEHTNS